MNLFLCFSRLRGKPWDLHVEWNIVDDAIVRHAPERGLQHRSMELRHFQSACDATV